MYITVSQLAAAINAKQHIRTGEIIKVITVMVVDSNRIHYQIIDSIGNIEYYNENSIPVSVVKLMNYNRPVKTWTKENKRFFQYHF